jgi:heme exporter protein C
MHRFANPNKFRKITELILPYSTVLMFLCFGVGLYMTFFASPPDYQQGDYVRIMYIHVPAAWCAVGCYMFLASMCAIGFVWKHPLAFMLADNTAPIGASFTLIALVTGSIWGKPTWGAWWVWDARLTSVLILFFLFLGFMALSNAFEHKERGLKSAGLLALVGLVNIPIIKWSVEWWNSLHQPASIMKAGMPSIHISMLIPLLIMAAAYGLYFITILLLRMKTNLLLVKFEVKKMRQI